MPDGLGGFTPVPNDVFSQLMELGASECKVMLFILRRTLGWHKAADRISLSQFERGVGQEPGTGLCRNTILQSVRGLEGKQFINVLRVVSPLGDADVSVYRLGERVLRHIGGWFKGQTTVVQRSDDGVVQPVNPQNKPLAKYTETTSSGDGAENAGRPRTDDDALLHRTEDAGSVEQRVAPVVPEPPGLDAAAEAVVGRLMAGPFGFSKRSAEGLLAQHAAAAVAATMDDVAQRRTVRNPAGYLVRQLAHGDYAPVARPRPVRVAVASEAALPELPADVERVELLVAALDEPTRVGLLEEARVRYARQWLRPVEQVDPESWMVRVAFEEIVRERFLKAS
jgi:hypothetical protein